MADIQHLVDHHWNGHRSLFIPLRVVISQELIYQLHHQAELLLREGEPVNLVVSGLNLVQADPDLGNYIELEVALDD